VTSRLISPFFLFIDFFPIFFPLNMFIIILLHLYPHKYKIWNVNAFVQSIVLSMMVVHLLAFVAPSAVMLISITLGCTFVCGYTPTSNTSSSTSFYVTCSSTYHYSTPLFSFDSSMYTGSIGVAHGLSYSLELQPLLGLPKTLLQMFLIYIYL